jgi:excisionase family DNA binding protein
MDNNYITTSETAELLGITIRGIRLAVESGKLPARRVGARMYMINRYDAINYKKNKRKPGRQKNK